MHEPGLGIHRVATKVHKCLFCNSPILIGEPYVLVAVKNTIGDILHIKMHLDCEGKAKEYFEKLCAYKMLPAIRSNNIDWAFLCSTYKFAWDMFFKEFLANCSYISSCDRLSYIYLNKVFDKHQLYYFFDKLGIYLFIMPTIIEGVCYYTFEIRNVEGKVCERMYTPYVTRLNSELSGFERMFAILDNLLTPASLPVSKLENV